MSSIPATVSAVQSIDFFDTNAVLPAFPGVGFGNSSTGDTGRNYIRTVENDYHTRDFTAYITVNRPPNAGSAVAPITINNPAVFFGFGVGDRAGNGNSPDRTTGNPTVFLELQSGFNNASRRVTGDSLNAERGFQSMNPLPSYTVNRVIRIRMRYNNTLKNVAYALDYDPVPGPFQEDQLISPSNSPTVDVTSQVAEWYAGENASIYFGGDRKVVFTDFVVEVDEISKPPVPTGLVKSEGEGIRATLSMAHHTSTMSPRPVTMSNPLRLPQSRPLPGHSKFFSISIMAHPPSQALAQWFQHLWGLLGTGSDLVRCRILRKAPWLCHPWDSTQLLQAFATTQTG